MHEDGRSKKIALISHCLLNQNAKVYGLARYPAQVPGIADMLAEYDYSVIQMPCPEMMAAGLRRWGAVKEQYNCYGYRRRYSELVSFTVDQIMDYAEEGYEIIIVGVDGSPSCGVDLTESHLNWGGSMMFYDEIDTPRDMPKAPGVFVELLLKEFEARGLKAPRAIGLPLDADDGAWDPELLRAFLSKA